MNPVSLPAAHSSAARCRSLAGLRPAAAGATVALACALASPVAHATKPPNITDAEMAMIPNYCVDTMGFNYGDAYYNTSPRAPQWVGIMGKGFWAIHHYCWALINLNRATKRGVNPEFRRGTLENVRSDYQYVLDHTTPDFILLPEVLTKLGELELMLARPEEAYRAFARARQVKPDYWPAYSGWAAFLIRAGKKAEARELIKTGLEYSPKSTVLEAQYRSVGGNPKDILPKPAPRPPAEPEPATEAAPPTAGPASRSGAATEANPAAK